MLLYAMVTILDEQKHDSGGYLRHFIAQLLESIEKMIW